MSVLNTIIPASPEQERTLQKMTLGLYLQHQLFLPLPWTRCGTVMPLAPQPAFVLADPGKYPLTYITAVSFHFVHLPVPEA